MCDREPGRTISVIIYTDRHAPSPPAHPHSAYDALIDQAKTSRRLRGLALWPGANQFGFGRDEMIRIDWRRRGERGLGGGREGGRWRRREGRGEEERRKRKGGGKGRGEEAEEEEEKKEEG